MMEALEKRGLERSVYLWSDDNLSTDYYVRMLSSSQRARIQAYPMYGRVCCFKGYDGESFAYNTLAARELFERQFTVFRSARANGSGASAFPPVAGTFVGTPFSGTTIYAVTTPVWPLGAAYSRRRERAADRYAVSVTGQGERYAETFERLVEQNLMELRPPRLWHALTASHPMPADRVAAARASG
jgi:hypothetical protein